MYATLFVSLLALVAPARAEPSVQTVEDNAGYVLCDAQEPGIEVSSGIVERLDEDGVVEVEEMVQGQLRFDTFHGESLPLRMGELVLVYRQGDSVTLVPGT